MNSRPISLVFSRFKSFSKREIRKSQFGSLAFLCSTCNNYTAFCLFVFSASHLVLKVVCTMENFIMKRKRCSPKSLALIVAAKAERYVVICKFARSCTTFTHHRQAASWSKGRMPAVRNCIVVSVFYIIIVFFC